MYTVNMIKLKVTPVAKPRMTRSDTWKKRPCVVRYWAYKDALVAEAERNNLILPEAYSVDFYLPMPEKSWSKKKWAEHDGRPHKQRPDLDNLLKGLNDCLLEEDSKVWSVFSQKFWTSDPVGWIEITPHHKHK